MKKALSVCLPAGFGISSLFLAITLSWLVLAKVDFLYSVWHDHAGIGIGIDRYAPQNRYKNGFEDTTREQRFALFSGINESIHNHGEGLRELRYRTRSSNGEHLLLREPEVVHLQDVANLLDILLWFAGLNALIWFAILVWLLKQKELYITWKSQLLGVIGACVVAGGIVIAIGSVKVFNQLHIWVFPDNHQWFFYYQDSLMSTMMLAPNLFGWIAVALILVALKIFFVLIYSTARIEKIIKS